MMQRLALSSLHTLPLLLALGCSPIDLTVGDKDASGGASGSGGAGSSASGGSNDKIPAGVPGKDEPAPAPSAGGRANDPLKDPSKQPPVSYFYCSGLVEKKILASLVCNGKKDCPDGSDELKCAPRGFVCDDGTEIDASLRCSASKECFDGSDEVGCPIPPFFCKDGSQLDAALVCNEKVDCPDKSDEVGCPIPPFFCEDGSSKLDPARVCDGNPDCLDKSDEANCPPPIFFCNNGSKLEQGLVCNGKDECGDGSDELDCGLSPFQCDAGLPIRTEWLCDGKEECKDGSDELACNCDAGVDQALRFDRTRNCLSPYEIIGCAKLIDPDLSVPADWPTTRCLVRKKDGATFLVDMPQLKSDWGECTPDDVKLLTQTDFCP